jgi:hypothetical protein
MRAMTSLLKEPAMNPAAPSPRKPMTPAQVRKLGLSEADEQLALDLAATETDYRRAAAKAEELRANRTQLTAVALDRGWTHARISELTGLTRGRVGQISMDRAS